MASQYPIGLPNATSGFNSTSFGAVPASNFGLPAATSVPAPNINFSSFGAVPASSFGLPSAPASGSFGLPSAPASGSFGLPSAPASGSFGLPSAPVPAPNFDFSSFGAVPASNFGLAASPVPAFASPGLPALSANQAASIGLPTMQSSQINLRPSFQTSSIGSNLPPLPLKQNPVPAPGYLIGGTLSSLTVASPAGLPPIGMQQTPGLPPIGMQQTPGLPPIGMQQTSSSSSSTVTQPSIEEFRAARSRSEENPSSHSMVGAAVTTPKPRIPYVKKTKFLEFRPGERLPVVPTIAPSAGHLPIGQPNLEVSEVTYIKLPEVKPRYPNLMQPLPNAQGVAEAPLLFPQEASYTGLLPGPKPVVTGSVDVVQGYVPTKVTTVSREVLVEMINTKRGGGRKSYTMAQLEAFIIQYGATPTGTTLAELANQLLGLINARALHQ